MRDFPVFTTQYGVASLVLKEIPYTGRGYIVMRSTLDPEALLNECMEFCVAVGAEQVYASGDQWLQKFPFHTSILKMQCPRDSLEETEAALWPVEEKTLEHWRMLYNEKSIKIPNGAWLSERECKNLLKEADAYFVHWDHQLLGTGLVTNNEILWVSSLVQGKGAEVVRALAHAMTTDVLELDVASENKKAFDLYKRLGFIVIEEKSRWYRVR